jgi:Family of unknown function (DUF6130)
MKPIERLTQGISVRAGIIVSAAMIVLALPSTSAQRVGPLMNATTAVGIAAATPAAGEPNGTTQTSSGTDVKVGPRSAKEVRGASPYLEIKNEPAPKLIVDPPLPDLLDQGVVWIQWRAENVHIVPVFGKNALNASPRVGHLHVHMDDLPWLWADASDINTIDLAGVPPGPHKILIELVNANHEVFPGQAKTVTFTVPKGTSPTHSH